MTGPARAPTTAPTKAVIVTGAAAGIGKATTLRFAAEGFFVCGLDVDAAGLDALAVALGDRGFARRVDVTDAAAVQSAVDDVVARCGRLDAFVNNAGVLTHGAFTDVDVARSRRMVDINVGGVVNGARAALPALRKTGGALVSMSSAACVYGTPGLAVYGATKAFVSNLTEGLALEESRRPATDRARVVDVLPGFVDTDMVRVAQKGSVLVEKMGVRLTADDVAAAIWRAVVEDGPVHRVLNLETRLQRALVGISPALGPLLVKLVERRG